MDKNPTKCGRRQITPYSVFALCAILFSVLCTVLVFVQLFAPALMVGEQAGNTAEYEYVSYSGIETAFLCWPAFILGGELIGPNPLLIAALILPVIVTLVCALLWKKERPIVRAAAGVLMAVFFILCAVCMLNAGELVLDTAYDKFVTVVYYAKERGMYGISGYAVFMSVMCILAAAVDIGAAAYGIVMKILHKPESPTEEKSE